LRVLRYVIGYVSIGFRWFWVPMFKILVFLPTDDEAVIVNKDMLSLYLAGFHIFSIQTVSSWKWSLLLDDKKRSPPSDGNWTCLFLTICAVLVFQYCASIWVFCTYWARYWKVFSNFLPIKEGCYIIQQLVGTRDLRTLRSPLFLLTIFISKKHSVLNSCTLWM
jgi:hypothetical protein